MTSIRDHYLEGLESALLKKAFKRIEEIDPDKTFEEHKIIFEDISSYVDIIMNTTIENSEFIKR